MTELDPEDLLTLKEVADACHLSKQAVYVAMRKKKIPVVMIKRTWHMKRRDFDAYRENKYNRDEKLDDEGNPVFDVHKGTFSAMQVWKVISATLRRPFTLQRLYYLLRTGELKSSKNGCSWVIQKEDAIDLLKKELGETTYNEGSA